MPYRDAETGRAHDRERFRQRTAERIARGLCPRCGKQPPTPGRATCEPCSEKRRAAERARDAKLRAAGRTRRDPEKTRAAERRRYRRQTDERRARGLCTKCGRAPAVPERTICEGCAEKRRAAERTRYAAGKAAGLPYGGRNPEAKRRSGRRSSRKRQQTRREAGLCPRCGQHRPPADGGTTCEPCRAARRTAGHALYADRRSDDRCGRCGGPTADGGSRCASCAALDTRNRDRKNVGARRRYARRRALGRCTDCGAAAQGAARCEPCARRSYERSDHFRGIPLWDASYTVFDLETGECHGTFDSEIDVALCLAFAKLSRDRVEIVVDRSPLATLTGW